MIRRRVGAFALAALLLAGCFPDISTPVQRATEALDRAIADISKNSAEWQDILERVASELPDEINATIRNEAQILVTRSIAVAGVEFRCNADFLGARAVASLERLKRWLQSEQEPPAAPPSLCQVAPASIDLKANPDSWSTITLAGYDLDHADSAGALLGLQMLGNDGSVRPVAQGRIGRTTHYQITVNARGLGSEMRDTGTVKLQATWGGSATGFPEIVVLPWEASRTTIIVTPSGTTWQPPRARQPGHALGDLDFDTSSTYPMEIEVRTEIKIGLQTVQGRVYLRADESGPDFTSARGWSDWESLVDIRLTHANYRILSVTPSTASSQKERLTHRGDYQYELPGQEAATRFRVWGDQEGDDAGVYTKVVVSWSRFKVTLEEVAPDWLK